MNEGIPSTDFRLKSILISSFIQPFKDSIIGLSVGVPALEIKRIILRVETCLVLVLLH